MPAALSSAAASAKILCTPHSSVNSTRSCRCHHYRAHTCTPLRLRRSMKEATRVRCGASRLEAKDITSVEATTGPELPAGVTLPPVLPSVPPAKFGFVDNAERLNSRAAMIGFFALLAVEAAAQTPFLELIGWNIGKGLNVGL